jgi:hypothetical protein
MEHGERGDPVGAQRSDDQPGGTKIITGDCEDTSLNQAFFPCVMI